MPDMFIELDRSDPAEHGPSSSRRPLGLRARPWVAAALVMATLLALGSAGGKQRPTLQLVANHAVQAEAELIAIDQSLLIVEPGALTALDPETARERWRIQTGLQWQWVEAEGDTLLVRGAGVVSASGPSAAESVAVAAATGQVLWRIPGNLERVGAFMVAYEKTYTPMPGGRLTVYNQAAQQLWSADAMPTLHAVDSEQQAVFTLNPTSGEIVRYRLDDGAVIDRTVEPELIGAAGMVATGGGMTAYFQDGRNVILRGSSLVSGGPSGPGEEFIRVRGERIDCGVVWCVSSFGPGIVLVDKATGEAAHAGLQWISAIRTDFGVVGMTLQVDDGESTIGVFDSATRRVRRITGWSLVGFQPDSRVHTWRGPVYLITSAPQRTFFAVVDGTGMHVAGSVPYEHLLQCVATTHLLACRVDPKTIKVWHPAA